MPRKYYYKNSHRLKEIRNFLRRNPTRAEEILWRHLRGNQLGHKFRRQFSIGNVVADFCCVQLKLVIEVDGWTHDLEKTQAKDIAKQKFFESLGYTVIRFTNEQVYGDIEILLDQLERVCSQPRGDTPTLALPLSGGGN